MIARKDCQCQASYVVTSDNDGECIMSLGPASDWLGGGGLCSVCSRQYSISSRHCGQLILVVRGDNGTGISWVARHESRINYLAM